MIKNFVSCLMGVSFLVAGCSLRVDQTANEAFTLDCGSSLVINCEWSPASPGCFDREDQNCPLAGDRTGRTFCSSKAVLPHKISCQAILPSNGYSHLCSEKEMQVFKDQLAWQGPDPAPQNIQIMPLGDGSSGCEVKMFW